MILNIIFLSTTRNEKIVAGSIRRYELAGGRTIAGVREY